MARKAHAIPYVALDSNVEKHGVWRGDPDEAVEAAEEYLAADDGGAGETWYYVAEETGDRYAVDREGMEAAGAAILSGENDWYSIWAATYGEEAAPEPEAYVPARRVGSMVEAIEKAISKSLTVQGVVELEVPGRSAKSYRRELEEAADDVTEYTEGVLYTGENIDGDTWKVLLT